MASGLVDYLGRPVQSNVLREEISAPSMAGVRNIYSTYYSRGITPQRMANLMIEAEQGAALAYLELAEVMEEKDLHYLSVLGTRKRAVSQLDITVQDAGDDARSKQDGDLVRQWLKRDTLQMELFDILDAIGKGFSATEIIWDMSARQWMPGQLKRRDPRWFQFDLVDGETLLLRDVGPPLPLAPFKFIVHTHPAKSGLPIRGGLARACSWLWLFKNFTIKDWVAFAEVFGMPLRIGKHDAGETKENIRKLAQAVANIGTDAAAVIAKSMDIEFLDGKGQSGAGGGAGQLYQSLAEYIDQQFSKAVLGQTATTDAIAGGHAVGKTHDGVRHDIMAADAYMLAGTLNRDLIRPMVDLNNGPPPSGAYPRVSLGLPEAVDIAALSNALNLLVPLGLKVGAGWARKKIGAPDPTDGEELLQAVAAPAKPTPESGAEEAEETEVATDPAEAAAMGFSRLSKPLTRPSKAAASGAPTPDGKPDAIDRGIDDALSDWRPLAEPLVKTVQDLVASCSSLEEVRDKLAGAIDGMDVDQVAQLLAQAGFSARLAGIAGATLD